MLRSPFYREVHWRVDSSGLETFTLYLKSFVGPFVRVGGSSGPATLSVTVHRQQEFSIWQELTGGPVVGVIVLSVRLSGQCRRAGWGRAQILSSCTGDSGVRLLNLQWSVLIIYNSS